MKKNNYLSTESVSLRSGFKFRRGLNFQVYSGWYCEMALGTAMIMSTLCLLSDLEFRFFIILIFS